MKLTEYLVPENIYYGVFLSSKKRALEAVGKYVAEYLNTHQVADFSEENPCCSVTCFTHLFKREKLGSTALNHGIALPHAKLSSITQPIAIFLQLEREIDFDAEDNKAVDLIYAVLFPELDCEQYKGTLAALAERLMDKNLLKQLRAAESAEDIWHILHYADQHIEQELG